MSRKRSLSAARTRGSRTTQHPVRRRHSAMPAASVALSAPSPCLRSARDGRVQSRSWVGTAQHGEHKATVPLMQPVRVSIGTLRVTQLACARALYGSEREGWETVHPKQVPSRRLGGCRGRAGPVLRPEACRGRPSGCARRPERRHPPSRSVHTPSRCCDPPALVATIGTRRFTPTCSAPV